MLAAGATGIRLGGRTRPVKMGTLCPQMPAATAAKDAPAPALPLTPPHGHCSRGEAPIRRAQMAVIAAKTGTSRCEPLRPPPPRALRAVPAHSSTLNVSASGLLGVLQKGHQEQ